MRLWVGVLLVAALAAPSAAVAGDVYGIIREAGEGAAADALLRASEDGAVDETRTNSDGAYRIYLSRGEYEFTVTYEGKTSSGVAVSVPSTGLRADFELQRAGDGWRLVRK